MATAMEELNAIIDQAILDIKASKDPFPEAKQKEVKALLKEIRSGGRITDNSAYDLMYKLGFDLYTKNRSALDSHSKQSFVLFREIFEAFYKKVDHPKTKAVICNYIASICDAYNRSVDNSRNAVAKYQEILGLIDQDVARADFNQNDPDIVINAGMFGAKLSNNDSVADRVLSAKGLIERSINGCYINILSSGDINKLPSEIIEEALSFFNGIKFQGIQPCADGSVNDNNIQFKQGSLLQAEALGIKKLRIFRNQIEGLVKQIEPDELDKKALKGEIRAEFQKEHQGKSGDKNELKHQIKEKIKQIKLEEKKRKQTLNTEINSTFALAKGLIIDSLNQNPPIPEDLIQSILILKTLSDAKNVDEQTKKLALGILSQIKQNIDLSCLLKDQLTARIDTPRQLYSMVGFLSEKGFSKVNQTKINNFAFDKDRPREGWSKIWGHLVGWRGIRGGNQVMEALIRKLTDQFNEKLPKIDEKKSVDDAFDVLEESEDESKSETLQFVMPRNLKDLDSYSPELEELFDELENRDQAEKDTKQKKVKAFINELSGLEAKFKADSKLQKYVAGRIRALDRHNINAIASYLGTDEGKKTSDVLKKILPPPIPTSIPGNISTQKFAESKLKDDLSQSPSTSPRSNEEFNLVNKALGEGCKPTMKDSSYGEILQSLQYKGNNLNAKVHEGTPGERIEKKEFTSPKFFYGKGILLEKGTLPYIDPDKRIWCIKVGEVVKGSHPHKLGLEEGDIISVSGIALEDNNENKEQVLIAMRKNKGFNVVESASCSKGYKKVNNVMLDNSGDKLKIYTLPEKEIGAEKLNSSNLGGR